MRALALACLRRCYLGGAERSSGKAPAGGDGRGPSHSIRARSSQAAGLTRNTPPLMPSPRSVSAIVAEVTLCQRTSAPSSCRLLVRSMRNPGRRRYATGERSRPREGPALQSATKLGVLLELFPGGRGKGGLPIDRFPQRFGAGGAVRPLQPPAVQRFGDESGRVRGYSGFLLLTGRVADPDMESGEQAG